MVGDRLDTDILFGNNAGMKSILVLSGVTTEDQALAPENDIVPDLYCDSIADFFGLATPKPNLDNKFRNTIHPS